MVPELNTTIILIALWTLPWKGVALWKAAQRSEKKWFIALLILNTLAILEIAYIFHFSKKDPESPTNTREKKPEISPDTPEKEDHKKKILEAVHEWKKISEETVARLLNINSATAALYLRELSAEGKISATSGSDGNATYRLKK